MKQRYCVECDWCGQRGGTSSSRNFCFKKLKALPYNVTSRPACKEFVATQGETHWGP